MHARACVWIYHEAGSCSGNLNVKRFRYPISDECNVCWKWTIKQSKTCTCDNISAVPNWLHNNVEDEILFCIGLIVSCMVCLVLSAVGLRLVPDTLEGDVAV